MNWFLRRRPRPHRRLGLLGMHNRRGLGTETRNFARILAQAVPEVRPDIHLLPTGRKAQTVLDGCAHNRGLLRWLAEQDAVMTIELFSEALLQACQERGKQTLWRPNHEWISARVPVAQYARLDHILAPQQACARLLRETLGLGNVTAIPWVLDAPVETKGPQSGAICRFVFNAGHGGIGDRRNAPTVVAGFARALAAGAPVHLTIKTQVEIDLAPLRPWVGTGFNYIQSNYSYQANLDTYRRADFSLAPSKWEGVGFALLESLHCGTPVLTVDAPPMNEWVEHGRTGWLVPAHFPDLPVPLPENTPREFGLNYVRAALCTPDDLATAICALAGQRQAFYGDFAAANQATLAARRAAFVVSLRRVLLGE